MHILHDPYPPGDPARFDNAGRFCLLAEQEETPRGRKALDELRPEILSTAARR